MKLLQVELRNYRGVEGRSVEFAPEGITVVEGPNEIGKSSIAEAIDLALEELDSTAKRAVVDTRPVGKDVGPEVSLDVETGPYLFHLRKRFLRSALTELHIERPHPEDLTGREAHERVRAILADTMDVGLWKALRIQQGSAVDQPSLADQSSLSAALDRAAGEVPAGEEEESLFEFAHSEYLNYWTETGRRKRESVGFGEAIDEAKANLARIEGALAQIEADVESSARLEQEIGGLRERDVRQAARLGELKAQLEQLKKREAEVTAIEAEWEVARTHTVAAADANRAREQAIADLEAAAAERTRLADEHETASAALETAKERVSTAEAALKSAESSRDRARDEAQLRRADLSWRRDEEDLAQLMERKTRIDVALAALESAAAVLGANKMDAATLEGINSLHHDIEVARARLDARAPHVRVEAMGAVNGAADGETFELASGDVFERTLVDSLTLSIPRVLTLSLTAGIEGISPVTQLQRDEEEFARLCAQAGAADAEDARRLRTQRMEAESMRAEQSRILAENLKELTPEAIESRLATLRTQVGQYRTERGSNPPIASTEAKARAMAEEADALLGRAERASTAASREADSARTRWNELQLDAGEVGVELRLAGEKVERLSAALDSARAEAPDTTLLARLDDAQSAAAVIVERLKSARADLDTENAEGIRQRFKVADEAVATTARELRSAEDELLAVQTRLRDHGEDGLAEDLDAARSALATAERDRDQYERRAAARRLLFDTLRDERDLARRSYVAPLQHQIERLGGFVFGNDFRVELDDELRIVKRTMGSQTIPFQSLSIGAKEQLGLITRLACAMIVSPDGGVPLVLDDALGNSDPVRLEGMCAVLSVAGHQSQIIMLTSQPDRYQQVGEARIVRLP